MKSKIVGNMRCGLCHCKQPGRSVGDCMDADTGCRERREAVTSEVALNRMFSPILGQKSYYLEPRGRGKISSILNAFLLTSFNMGFNLFFFFWSQRLLFKLGDFDALCFSNI